MTELIKMKLKDIHPYEKNPRKNDEAVEAVANSIKEFGMKQPIVVDKDGVIIVGHTRYKALKKLGIKETDVIVADDLTEEQVKAYRIADNSTNEVATWDYDLLLGEIQSVDYDFSDFGMNLIRTEDGVDFSNLEQYKDQEHTEEYDAFLDKFKEKHTTDDCFTPPAVYDAIVQWATQTYGLEGRQVVRPFYPGGDYEHYTYPDGCVVIDNPPFSILKQIVLFYQRNGIDFFIFADGRTCGWYFEIANVVIAGADIIYDNGADVRTAFVTNMGNDRIKVSAELYNMINEAQPKESNELQSYKYPDNLITAMMLDRLPKYGSEFSINNIEFVKNMDDGHQIYGGGALVSDKEAQRIKSEQSNAEQVKADRAKARFDNMFVDKEEKIIIGLSDRERAIIERLNAQEAVE